ncbi:MAG: type II toxin-antitoxin system RelE/ParE family toxin [Saprospiraceae bacterium]|nr:type II toxin-antitoxin system RelE/ParE family toxin [Saprospiraceae bacterium]
MAQVNWTFQALEDVAAIGEYHEAYSEKYASHLIQAFFAKAELLASFPMMGRVVPETNIASIRELVVSNYRIIYTVADKEEVNILTVCHSSRPLTDFPIQ